MGLPRKDVTYYIVIALENA